MTSSAMAARRLEGLDALRGIAAICVLVHHLVPSSRSIAYLSVDFFFMLSGFVMARGFEARLAAEGPASVRGFLSARICRLWPLMAFGCVIGLFGDLWRSVSDPMLAVAATFLLIPLETSLGQFVLNRPAWSLFYELVANAFHALALARMATRRIVLLIAAFVVLLGLGIAPHGLAINSLSNNVVLLGLRAMIAYGLGIVLWRTWGDAPPFAPPAWLTFAALPGWFLLAWFTFGPGFLADMGFVLLISPLLVMGGVVHARGSRLAKMLGAISFPLYAIHHPIVSELSFAGYPTWCQFLVPLLAACLLTAALAWLKARRRSSPLASGSNDRGGTPRGAASPRARLTRPRLRRALRGLP